MLDNITRFTASVLSKYPYSACHRSVVINCCKFPRVRLDLNFLNLLPIYSPKTEYSSLGVESDATIIWRSSKLGYEGNSVGETTSRFIFGLAWRFRPRLAAGLAEDTSSSHSSSDCWTKWTLSTFWSSSTYPDCSSSCEQFRFLVECECFK